VSTPRVSPTAVVMAAIAYFAVGGLWYSPILFTNTWLDLIGKSFDEVKAHGAAPYKYAVLAAAVISYGLARLMIATNTRGAIRGAALGASVALVFATAAAAPGYLFEMRPVSLFAINAGYPIVGMTLCGAILGLALTERTTVHSSDGSQTGRARWHT
jgi:hypothetical protein